MNTNEKKKIFIQIFLIIAIALFFHFFIDTQIYRPLLKESHNFLESDESVAIFSISLWTFACSIAYWIYPQKILSNFIVAIIPVLTVVMAINIYYNFFWDFLHWIPLILGYFIFIKYRNHLDEKLLLFTFLCLFWGLINCLYTPNYSYIEPLRNGIWIALIWILISYLILKFSPLLDRKIKYRVQ